MLTLDANRLISNNEAKDVQLTPNTALILELLIHKNGKVCSSDDIGLYLYGQDWYDADTELSAIEQAVCRLRKRLGFDCVETRRGKGYYLKEADQFKVVYAPRWEQTAFALNC